MRKLLSGIACAFTLTAAPAFAQPVAPVSPPVYAVLSLIGDQLGIVVAQPPTDAKFSPYRRDVLIIEESIFDDAAIGAASDAIRKVIPQAELSALNTRSQVLFDRQRVLFEEKGSVISVPDAIKTAIRQQNATYLILITKHRDEMNLQFGQDRDASGKLEGLGFYVDDTIHATTNGAGCRAFIAPFAYVRVALIDTKSWKVIGKQVITASTTIASANAQDASSQWAAMTAAEKVRSIDRLLRREMARVIPPMLKAG